MDAKGCPRRQVLDKLNLAIRPPRTTKNDTADHAARTTLGPSPCPGARAAGRQHMSVKELQQRTSHDDSRKAAT
jgi:hypothetical protein